LIAAGIEHDQLDKRSGFLRHFPLRRTLACPQADNGTANPNTLARLEFDIAHQAVAFVQQSEDSDTLLHRRDALVNVIGALRCACLRQRARICRGRRIFSLAVATGKDRRTQQPTKNGQRCTHRLHAASGVQG
jgi:hypothetical protein